MSEEAAPPPESAAWATVEVRASPAEVLAHCQDVATLLRLNPYLEIRSWSGAPGPLAPGQRYRLHALNEWTGIERAMDLRVEAVEADGFRLAYAQGLKHRLDVRVAPHGEGTALTLKEHYRDGPEVDRAALEKEIDRSLTPWAAALRRDLHRLRRWGWVPGYRRLRVWWLAMRPRERRIGRMLVWATALEFVVFLFVFAIYWNEASR